MKKQTFKVQNVKSSGCANSLTSKLKNALKGLGYPFEGESFGFVQDSSMKAKSFVSCAVGKFEVAKGN